jgi:glycerol-3-phosphate O-acyltransferase/dihydroxyacetone phosphate acyltransferase
VIRRAVDIILTAIVRVVLRGFFRRVEVDGDASITTGRPVLVVANHFYGFMDPVALAYVFARIPRFLAKSTLFKLLPLRPLLALAGVIPVARQQDGSDTSTNDRIFAACSRVLGRGGLVGIFPEGTTHDDPRMRTVRTGAARIALGAYEDGVTELVIVPVGLVFDDKVALRSRMLARIGHPLPMQLLARELIDRGMQPSEDDREAVRYLTDRIATELRAVAPNYDEPRLEHVLRRAAEVTIRAEDGVRTGQVSLADEERLARQIAVSGDDAVARVDAALARYHLDLDIAGIGDLQVESHTDVRDLLRRSVVATVWLTLLTPLAIIGLSWNVVPYTLVQLAGRVVPRPVTKGTIRLSTALLVFPLTWAFIAWTDAWDGFWPGLGVWVIAPLLGIIAIVWLEGLVKGYRDWRGWLALTDRRALLPAIAVARNGVVTAVRAAVPRGATSHDVG